MTNPPDVPRPVLRPLSQLAIVISVLVLLVLAVGVVWLLLAIGIDSVELDVVRTGGTLVVGAGGAVALLLAARRQRTVELDLLQKYEAHQLAEQVAGNSHAHQQRVADAGERDAVERRVTELYSHAADQLGSDKAPVRLAGLYALERLAQGNPEHRQSIVNVLCAYLRMPYVPPTNPSFVARPLGRRRPIRPGRTPAPTAAPQSRGTNTAREEREVRLTAQRILTSHLRPGADLDSPAATFWPDITLDLTGATLINLNFDRCHVSAASFVRTQFVGDPELGELTSQDAGKFTRTARFDWAARFDRAAFTGPVSFDGATFTDSVWLAGATFAGDARFDNATFAGDARFDSSVFAETAWFNEGTFSRRAAFTSASFQDSAFFDGARFVAGVEFGQVEFIGTVDFDDVDFGKSAYFYGAKVRADASFAGAVFGGSVNFTWATFDQAAKFDNATVAGPVVADGAYFDEGAPAEFDRSSTSR